MTTRRFIMAVAAMAALLAGAVAVCLRSVCGPTAVTRDNFLRLATGMSESEVEEVFGENGEFWRASIEVSDHGLYKKCWVGHGIAYLSFDQKNGRLHHKSWREKGFSSQTKQNSERVRVGMLSGAVKEVFGRPPDVAVERLLQDVTEAWRDIDGEALVRYLGGRITETHWHYAPFFGDSDVEPAPSHSLRRSLRRLCEAD